MYQPPHFRVEDQAVLHAFIAAHPLGLLIGRDGERPVADLVPFHLDPTSGPKGRLRAHLARANPHWKLLQCGGTALVVFQVSGHYISPSWYPSKQEHHRVVPTWNYAMVQVRGRATVFEDAPWLRAQVEALTGQHEAGRSAAWQVQDAPEDFIASQLRAIVGFEIEIEEMMGKFKLSQNRPEGDRTSVVSALGQEGPGGADLAAMMRDLGIGTGSGH